MLLTGISIPVYTVRKPQTLTLQSNHYPVLTIDRDSYIVGAQIETGINFAWEEGVHSIQIGRYSSLAEEITFLIDMNHDYRSVYQGSISGLTDTDRRHPYRIKRKGQIIIENDCWIGHGAILLGGVTVHNGGVVAASSVVTKDVPPYAIVGGNPARVLKYRFPQEIIQELLKIAWWDWTEEKIRGNQEWMEGEVEEFIRHFRGESFEPDPSLPFFERMTGGKRFVYYLDFREQYPVYPRVIAEFVQKYRDTEQELMLIGKRDDPEYQKFFPQLLQFLESFAEYNVFINLYDEAMRDDTDVLYTADYYITNREVENIRRMGKAEVYGVQVISGVDMPVF